MPARPSCAMKMPVKGPSPPAQFAHLFDLQVQDMCDVGKAPWRFKQSTLDALKAQCGKGRAKEGAVPATLSAHSGHPKPVLAHAAAVHGADVKVGPVDLARAALKRLGLVGTSPARPSSHPPGNQTTA